MFIEYTGNTESLPKNDSYIVFKYFDKSCKILFSVTRQGKAAVCHFYSDKPGLRKLKQAILCWCTFCFSIFNWCEMIVGLIEKPSVKRLVTRCGFENAGNFKNIYIMIKERPWES